jgi:hypothetical protein
MLNLKEDPKTGGVFVSLAPLIDADMEEFVPLSYTRRLEIAYSDEEIHPQDKYTL